MKTKKIYAVLLAAAIAAMPVSVYAGSKEDIAVPGSQDIDVQAKYESSMTASKKYSVDVSWGAMQFTYEESGTQVWNADTHKYDQNTNGEWSASGNDITVTNHSNAAVDAAIAYQSKSSYSTITGTITETKGGTDTLNSFRLKTAENTPVSAAPSKTVYLNLGGTIDKSMTAFTNVGTVTVSLTTAE